LSTAKLITSPEEMALVLSLDSGLFNDMAAVSDLPPKTAATAAAKQLKLMRLSGDNLD
jgi:hypothetical protein